MDELNIPIYRAKKIDSDEYIDGYYFHQEVQADYINKDADEREEYVEHYIFDYSSHDTWDDEENFFNFSNLNKIDPSTLAIHFPDMIDAEGTKIFAGLNKKGTGGDTLTRNGMIFDLRFVKKLGFRMILATGIILEFTNQGLRHTKVTRIQE